VKVYVEQFSAHPLEADAAELYGAPDGFIAADGSFSKQKTSAADKPVYEIELKPEDGLYPLPYMALQADGSAWEEETVAPFSDKTRQGFFPDGSRSFEDIDRMSVGADGKVNLSRPRRSRLLPRRPARRLHQGRAARQACRRRSGRHTGRAPGPRVLRLQAVPPRQVAAAPVLAKITNDVQAVMSSGKYDGAIWTQARHRSRRAPTGSTC